MKDLLSLLSDNRSYPFMRTILMMFVAGIVFPQSLLATHNLAGQITAQRNDSTNSKQL